MQHSDKELTRIMSDYGVLNECNITAAIVICVAKDYAEILAAECEEEGIISGRLSMLDELESEGS